MLVYEGTKELFLNSVVNGTIDEEIYEAYQEKVGRTTKKEIASWTNSMKDMYLVLETKEIPNEAGIAIEFRIPSTSKRVDFMISGKSDEGKSSVIIIELKQWSEVELVSDKDGIIKTPLGRGFHETTHPSYQAWSYYNLIKDFNETVQNESIGIHPCAYLHNLNKTTYPEIEDDVYKFYIKQAPVYTKGDAMILRDFIKKFIKIGDNREALYKIDKGRLKPSKSLQDSLKNMIKGNREFTLIDDQKVVYEEGTKMAVQSHKDKKKRVLIVEGGPGTGKSVLAINLLVHLTSKNCVTHYISKNSAPRNVYSAKLKGSVTKSHIDNLFKGSGIFHDCKPNLFDALIVDEAHRLNKKSGLFKNKGENQIKEIIRSSKFSVFFIDESQRVDIYDIGRKDTIIKFSEEQGAEFKILNLESQFRCNGSDGYLAWLDDVLEIRKTANYDGFDKEYYFRVIDDPNELKRLVLEKNSLSNKARLLAGYCWNWNKDGKNKTHIHDINIKEFDFSMSWNLGNTSTWAIDSESVNEIGCIHTSQGLEFDYVGVIIGNDLRYEEGIITDFTKRAITDKSLFGIKGMFKKDPEKAKKVADEIIKNTYRTLMTRGQKGCYVYCCDKNLAEYLKKRINQQNDKNQ
ncbi:DUF2075 domain-containing protein [Candidatus Woesearchaeota archaeon]|nr:DUF2075 domain-containing protein [Candidatus Woesearchaeota archaeon]